MKIEVFNYACIHQDGVKEETDVSPCKVTRKYFEDQKKHGMGAIYQIIEGSRDLVEDCLVIDGKYHPELRIRN